MLDCRYYDLCCFTDDSCNGEPECPKRDHCQFYSPMPDVKSLAGLADEVSRCRYLSARACEETHRGWAGRIREALGVER